VRGRSGPAVSSVAGVLAGLLALGFAPVSPVAAQQAAMAKDLEFPSAPVPLSEFSVPAMVLLKPDGPGPFPALVLHHQCGGLRRGQWRNQSMREWAVKAVNRGYVVLLIDSLGPREVDWVCMGPKGGVNLGRGVRDALQGASHLRKFPFVDAGRIAHVGYSWGAMVGLLANSRSFRYFMESSANFAAYVSFYPGCFTVKRPDGSPFDIVRSDLDSRHLVLMGGKDTETPADDCAARLAAAKTVGAPVEWEIYAGATHCWDCENLDGRSKIDMRGNHVSYRYDAALTREAETRMFGFLEKALNAER
jgi:dienelactone hydrolase